MFNFKLLELLLNQVPSTQILLTVIRGCAVPCGQCVLLEETAGCATAYELKARVLKQQLGC